MSEPYKHDVAISLRAQDAALAEQLQKALAPLKVFVFTQRQGDLAGRDLVETFSEVFKRDARLAVILYRQGWGETDYTDLEAIAIRSRGLQTRWRSPVLIALDDTPVPVWYPDVYGYLDFNRYGFDEAVGVIRARAEELGVVTRPETPSERAAKRLAALQGANDRRERMNSALAVDDVYAEVQRLFTHLEQHVSELAPLAADLGARWGGQAAGEPVRGIRTTRYSTNVLWRQRFSNSIRAAALIVSHAPQNWPMPGELGATMPYNEREIRQDYYGPVLLENGWKWQESSANERRESDVEVRVTNAPTYTSDELAERIVSQHVDRHFAALATPAWRRV